MAGQVTFFFEYSRGSNGKFAAKASDAMEMSKKVTADITCTKIMV